MLHFYFQIFFKMLISQSREKQANSYTELTWEGKTIPVKNELVRAFLLRVDDSEHELERAESFENKMTVFDQLLMECKDGLQSVKDEMKPDQVYMYSFYCLKLTMMHAQQGLLLHSLIS